MSLRTLAASAIVSGMGAALTVLPIVSTRAADLTATDLATALQQRYSTIRDFSADFVQEYEGGVLKKRVVERGSVIVKKPGKWRWDYKSPEKKQFVCDGARVFQYYPVDKQVFTSPAPRDDDPTTPVLFLAGKGDLTRDFTATLTPLPGGMPAGSRALKLAPKTPQPDYDWLILVVDPASYALRGLVTIDAQGGTSSFTFTNMKENTGVSDKTFFFPIPSGVDVISDTPRR